MNQYTAEGTCAVTVRPVSVGCSDLNVQCWGWGHSSSWRRRAKAGELLSYLLLPEGLGLMPKAFQGVWKLLFNLSHPGRTGGAWSHEVKEATWEVNSLVIYGMCSRKASAWWRSGEYGPSSPHPCFSFSLPKTTPHQPCQCDINGLILISWSSSI